MIVNNDGSIPSEDVLAVFSDTEVVLLGDTRHSNPAIKGAAFAIVVELHKLGFSMLWLELDKKNQGSLDTILKGNPTYEEILQWVPAKSNKPTFVQGISEAHSLGFEIGLLDDKKDLNAFKKANEEFIKIQTPFRNKRAEGLDILAAEAAAFSGLTQEQVSAYREKEQEWQVLRDQINPGFASRILNSAMEHPKQVAITGDGHFNGIDDLDEILQLSAKSTCTVHVYGNLSEYGEYLNLYIDHMPNDGNPRKTPDLLYLVQTGGWLKADSPMVMLNARQEYDRTRSETQHNEVTEE